MRQLPYSVPLCSTTHWSRVRCDASRCLPANDSRCSAGRMPPWSWRRGGRGRGVGLSGGQGCGQCVLGRCPSKEGSQRGPCTGARFWKARPVPCDHFMPKCYVPRHGNVSRALARLHANLLGAVPSLAVHRRYVPRHGHHATNQVPTCQSNFLARRPCRRATIFMDFPFQPCFANVPQGPITVSCCPTTRMHTHPYGQAQLLHPHGPPHAQQERTARVAAGGGVNRRAVLVRGVLRAVHGYMTYGVHQGSDQAKHAFTGLHGGQGLQR